MKTIYYKNLMVDIDAESLKSGEWQSQWWIWSKNYTEIVRFFYSGQFNSEEQANVFAEISAIEYIDLDEIY